MCTDDADDPFTHSSIVTLNRIIWEVLEMWTSLSLRDNFDILDQIFLETRIFFIKSN